MSVEKISVNDWIKSLVEKESKRDPPAMEGAEEAVDEIVRNIRKARFHYANEERRTQMEIDLVTDQITAEKKNYEALVERNLQLDEKVAELKRKEEELDRRNNVPTVAQLRKQFFNNYVPLTAELKEFAKTQLAQADINAMCSEAGVAVCVSSGTYKLFMPDDPSVAAVEVKMQENFEDTKELIAEAIETLTLKQADESSYDSTGINEDSTMINDNTAGINDNTTGINDNTTEESTVGPMTELPSLVPYTDSSAEDSFC